MRTVIFIFDSVRYDAALAHKGLENVLDWDRIIPAGAHAPYTPSSLTTIASGLHPATHQYWTFPTTEDIKPSPNSLIFSWNLPVKWTATNSDASYAWTFSSYTAQPVNFLKDHNNCILFVHVWETHCPYGYDMTIEEATKEIKDRETLDDKIEFVNNGLTKGLQLCGEIFDEIAPDDLVIFTADHGEALGEPHPNVPGLERFMHQRVCLEEMLVPFFVAGDPDFDRDFISHIGILPYLMDKYGHDHTVDDTVYPDSSYSVCRWAYGDESWLEEGILALEDGKIEWGNVSGSNQYFSHDALKDYLQSYRMVYGDPSMISLDPISEDKQMRKKLEALGYLS